MVSVAQSYFLTMACTDAAVVEWPALLQAWTPPWLLFPVSQRPAELLCGRACLAATWLALLGLAVVMVGWPALL